MGWHICIAQLVSVWNYWTGNWALCGCRSWCWCSQLCSSAEHKPAAALQLTALVRLGLAQSWLVRGRYSPYPNWNDGEEFSTTPGPYNALLFFSCLPSYLHICSNTLQCGTQLYISKWKVVQRAPLRYRRWKQAPGINAEQLMCCPCPGAPALLRRVFSLGSVLEVALILRFWLKLGQKRNMIILMWATGTGL